MVKKVFGEIPTTTLGETSTTAAKIKVSCRLADYLLVYYDKINVKKWETPTLAEGHQPVEWSVGHRPWRQKIK